MRLDPTLPTLSELLATCCFAEIARRIGRPRGYVWRMRHAGTLPTESMIAPLARALHRDEEFLRRVCINDAIRRRQQGRAS